MADFCGVGSDHHVIEAAIKHKAHVLTTSYISPEMEALEGKAKEAGIQVVNELGLDPGIDHLWSVPSGGSKLHAWLTKFSGP